LVRSGGISGSFGLAMGILARMRLAKIRTMARPNSPAVMPPKRTKKVRLGINIVPASGQGSTSGNKEHLTIRLIVEEILNIFSRLVPL